MLQLFITTSSMNMTCFAGESVGEHSADFKEAIFVEEAEEAVAISEKNSSEKAQTVSES